MGDVAHLIGNGKSSGFYQHAKGLKIACNLPPFEVQNLYTTVMVDFKMMNAIHKQNITVPGDWVLGARPHKWMEMKNEFQTLSQLTDMAVMNADHESGSSSAIP